MEKIADSLSERPAGFTIRGAFEKLRADWAFVKSHHGERTLDEVLERYDPNATDGDTDDAILGPKTKVRVRVLLTGRRRVIAGLCLLCWMILVNCVTFYSIMSLEDKTTTILETIKSTSYKVHDSVAESLEELKHPSNPTEVANLMTEFYELLAKMGLYEPSTIAYPPHLNPGINTTFAEMLEYSQKAIEMMEMLPYVGPGNGSETPFTWSHGAGDNEFLLYGTFVDYRKEEYLEERDPLYALDTGDDGQIKDFDEDGGKYMKPDYILLSALGNHGAIMVLNTNNYKLWTIDSESDGSADFALQNVEMQESSNRLSLSNYPSRPARYALRDYMQKFIDLEWMPGGLSSGDWTGDEYARLYVENGWPDNFNRDAFMIARSNWEEEESKRWDAEQPFEEVKKFENWLTSSLDQIKRKQEAISESDAGKELPPDYPDRNTYRQKLTDEVNEEIERLPRLQAELEVARETLKGIDPQVKKVREDRIAKYGY